MSEQPAVEVVVVAPSLLSILEREGTEWHKMTRAEVREYIRNWNRRYNRGQEVDEPKVRDGIEFWCVGHNASHEFNAGVGPDGRMYSYAAGEELVGRERYEKALEKLDNDVRFRGVDLLKPGNEALHEEWVLQYFDIEQECFDFVVSEVREVPDFSGYFGHF